MQETKASSPFTRFFWQPIAVPQSYTGGDTEQVISPDVIGGQKGPESKHGSIHIPSSTSSNSAHRIPAAERFNAYYVLAILNAGGIFGRIAPAWLSDTFGHFNLLFPAAFLSGLSCVTLWLCSRTIVLLLAFAAVYGFLSGAFVSLITPCIVRISDPSEIGTRIGMLYTIISIP
ncbi:hypothetical protein NMY22_g19559 [Coprinellus aureogranulatus]|nr:hypothetical protein NMY22_g19559 [Coprinellus aureogranulatus]